MRILLINSEYPPIGGGAGNASANLARCLASLGHEVTVLTAAFQDLPALEMQGQVTVRRVPALRRWMDRSSAFEQLSFILAASLAGLRLGREAKPEAVLAFFGMPSGAAAWLLKKVHRLPYVVSLRGGDVPGFRPYDFKLYHRLIGPVLRLVWRDASAVVANSRGLRDLALAFDARVEIPIIPNGVDAGRFEAAPRDWSIPSILSVGRIVHQKGLDLGLRALAGLKDLDWHWRIAGDGPQMGPLQSLSQELGLAERVTFLGWQSRDELSRWYHSSTLFLFPSRHEGMPNAVLEAMAAGLPVIASRIAGNEELVIDGLTGRLVQPEAVEPLRECLRSLLAEPDLQERMGRAARSRVQMEYSWENTARQYSLILENLR